VSADLIRVRPAPERRAEFAAWAVVQQPKLRMVSHAEFGVPSRLYASMPEALLVGALVDGHLYVPVPDVAVEHDSEGMAALGTMDGREPNEGGLDVKGVSGPQVVLHVDATPAAAARVVERMGRPLATGGVVAPSARLARVGESGSPPERPEQVDEHEPSERPLEPTGTSEPDSTEDAGIVLRSDDVPVVSDAGAAAHDGGGEAASGAAGDEHSCPADGCGRTFKSPRAVSVHQWQAHPAPERED
jgi:hypothetical protein